MVEASPTNARGWRLFSMLGDTWRRFRADARQLGSRCIAAFGLWVVGLYVLCLAFVWGLTTLGRHLANQGMAAWDHDVTILVRDSPLKFTDGILFESPGNLSTLMPATAIGMVMAARHGRTLLAMAFPIAYIGARPLIWFGWEIWDRARPDFIAEGAAALAAHSYPSGHVVQVITIYGLYVWWWMSSTRAWTERILAGVLLTALACIVGLARVRLGAHWPSDTIAGGLVGLAWLVSLVLAMRMAIRRSAIT